MLMHLQYRLFIIKKHIIFAIVLNQYSRITQNQLLKKCFYEKVQRI